MDPSADLTVPSLDARASGLRHLRWAREALGSLEGHRLEVGPPVQLREQLDKACDSLAPAIDALSDTVKAYRDFLERVRTRVRGRVRAGRVWGVDHTGLLAACDSERREPLRRAVRAQVSVLRSTLEGVLASLNEWPAVQQSLLPPLAGSHHVADIPDDDDDATA